MCFRKTFIVTTITLLVLAACSNQAPIDQTIRGVNFEIPKMETSETPKFSRIITLASGSFEIIEALGYRSNIVGLGLTEKNNRNVDLVDVTSGHVVDIEKILYLKPDLILTDEITKLDDAQLIVSRRAGIDVRQLGSFYSINGVVEKIRQISNLLEVPNAGTLLIQNLGDSIQYPTLDLKVAFLYLRGSNSIYLFGGKGSGADQLIKSAGGIDIGAAKFNTPFTPLTPEAVVELNPDVYILMEKGLNSAGGVEGFLSLPGISQTTAGVRESLIVVEDELLLSYGVKTYQLIRVLNEKFRNFSED